jgi:chemotaxis response regulator CheB
MSQTTAQDRLRAQIEAARRSLGDTALPAAANDSAQPVASMMPAQHHDPEPEFQFFYRKQVPADTVTGVGGTAGGAASIRAVFESLQGRVQHLEGTIALHQKHTLELINLLSQVDRKTLRPAGKSMRRLRAKQQFLFWLVLGLLGVGWVALTPAGHDIINHLLALI